MNELHQRGKIVQKMRNKRNSDNVIKARISQFAIDVGSLMTANAADAKETESSDMEYSSNGHLTEVYESVHIVEESPDRESSRSIRSERLQAEADMIDLVMQD